MCGMWGGIALGLFSTFSDMQSARSQGKHERAVLESQAAAERTSQALESEDRQRRMIAAVASQKVQFGASGALIEPGVLAATSGEFAKEQFNSDFNSDIRLQNIFGNIQSSKITQSNAITGSLFEGAANVFSVATGPLSKPGV